MGFRLEVCERSVEWICIREVVKYVPGTAMGHQIIVYRKKMGPGLKDVRDIFLDNHVFREVEEVQPFV